MPYPSVTDASGIIARVEKHFLHNQDYKSRQVDSTYLLYLMNEALDDIYQDCFDEQDKQSFTTTADTYAYAISGASTVSGVTDNIDEILRVEYDGGVLERYIFIDELLTPSSSDVSSTPLKWYETWDGGIRYLNLHPTPDDALTVDMYVTIWPVALTDTTKIPSLSKDFWKLLAAYIIRDVYLWLMDESPAKYQAQYAIWSNRVEAGKRTLSRIQKARLGKQFNKRHYTVANDHYKGYSI